MSRSRPAPSVTESRRALVERARDRLVRTSSPRLHASLIVALSGLTAFLSSVVMLRAGIDGMTLRYTLAAVMGYLAFVGLIRGWIGLHRRDDGDRGEGLQLPDVIGGGSGGGPSGGRPSLGFGGGRSGGGGVSSSFVDTSTAASLPRAGAGSGSSSGSSGAGVSLDLDLDELVWVLLAIALVCIGVVAVAYVIYVAPLLLAEVTLDAALLGGAYRRIRREEAQHWTTGVFRRTAIPAVIVVLCAAGVGYCGERLAPEARSIGGVVRMLAQRAR